MAHNATIEFLKKLFKKENSHQLGSGLTNIEHILLDYYQTFAKNHKDLFVLFQQMVKLSRKIKIYLIT